jgi:hypothetical protein
VFTVESQVPENDQCVNAVLLVEGEPATGNNTEANYDFINQGVCGARSDRRALWYEIIGVGKEATVYVCTNNDKLTDYGVFTQCNTQNCQGHPPQQANVTSCDEDEANIYSFLAANGESYYVHVRSDTLDPEGSNFTIWYTEPSDEPSAAPLSGAASRRGVATTTAGMTAPMSYVASVLSGMTAATVAAIFLMG